MANAKSPYQMCHFMAWSLISAYRYS